MSDHIVLSSHPKAPHSRKAGSFFDIRRGAPTATERGPVIASRIDPTQRKAIAARTPVPVPSI